MTTALTTLALAVSIALLPRSAAAQSPGPVTPHDMHAGAAPITAGSEEAAVRETLRHYLAGHRTGDGAHFRQAFHPDARLFVVRDGRVTFVPIAQYIAGAPGKPADDEAQRQRRIVSIDIAGNAAVARLELDYPTVKFVDFMTLLKAEGRWQIVDKTVYAEQKTR